jgi:hypothetical protein
MCFHFLRNHLVRAEVPEMSKSFPERGSKVPELSDCKLQFSDLKISVLENAFTKFKLRESEL